MGEGGCGAWHLASSRSPGPRSRYAGDKPNPTGIFKGPDVHGEGGGEPMVGAPVLGWM